MLFGKIVVHRDQDVEVFLRRTQQFPVLQSFPAGIIYRLNLGSLEAKPQVYGDVLVKEHLQSVFSCGLGHGVTGRGKTRDSSVRRWGNPAGIPGWCDSL